MTVVDAHKFLLSTRHHFHLLGTTTSIRKHNTPSKEKGTPILTPNTFLLGTKFICRTYITTPMGSRHYRLGLTTHQSRTLIATLLGSHHNPFGLSLQPIWAHITTPLSSLSNGSRQTFDQVFFKQHTSARN